MGLFRKRKKVEVSLDEILLDSSNLPAFDVGRMEGRIELPLPRFNLIAVMVIFILVASIFLYQMFTLQVVDGEKHRVQSEKNRLSHALVVAERGIVYDRYGELLAWNERDHTGQYDFPVRAYTDRRGLGQLVGYVRYPQKDTAGFYYRTEYEGVSGVEGAYHYDLEGENGKRLVEVTALGEVIAQNVVEDPVSGAEITLSLDAELSEYMHDVIASSTETLGFRSGAGAIMDVNTGEILALSSFPSYDPEVLSDGDDVDQINAYNQDDRYPFLNKTISGVYTPGSIVKPFVAYAALNEGIITPNTTIVSNGSIVVPNPYNPANPSVFNDWRAHGKMTVRDGLAYSSNVFFYTIGGGFEGQAGLGITKLHKYFKKFGIGDKTGVRLGSEIEGTVPNPDWKQAVFDDDWRLGDTYFTSIGQYGFLVTPLSMLKAYASLANGGYLVTPQVIKGSQGEIENLHLDPTHLKVVQEGMRGTVIQAGGTARALERKDLEIAAKSGTAELDSSNSFVNSWIAGYWPYQEPKYAFILFIEHGPYENTLGAGRVMSWVFDWMAENRPEYMGFEEKTSE